MNCSLFGKFVCLQMADETDRQLFYPYGWQVLIRALVAWSMATFGISGTLV